MCDEQGELFPEGRFIFYEGDDPKRFRREIKAEFGFDPGPAPEEGFLCPPEHLDAIYGDERFPTGS
jgi:hypothetical protein